MRNNKYTLPGLCICIILQTNDHLATNARIVELANIACEGGMH